MNLPNKLTILRILLVPLLVFVYYTVESSLLRASLFVLASLTDWLDGYAARQRSQITPLGAFLDPVADKLLVVSVLVLLMTHYHTWWLTVPGIVIISRELFASSLREWLAHNATSHKIKVSWVAKCKTAFQMVALTMLLYADVKTSLIWQVGYLFLMISVLLSLYSLGKYVKSVWPVLTFGIKQE